MKVAVIGCGIIGLTSAHYIQEKIFNSRITIFADTFTPNTTSDGAAGVCVPEQFADNSIQNLRKWFTASLKYIRHTLRNNPNASLMGFSQAQGYYVSLQNSTDFVPEFADLMLDLKQMTKSELKQFPKDVKSGFSMTVNFIECKKFLPWLMNDFLSKGGEIVTRNVTSIESLAEDFDVIVNCTGLGAKKLTQDQNLFPVRGHVIRLKAPWVKHFIFYDKKSHEIKRNLPFLLPNQDTLVAGAINEKFSSDLTIHSADKQHILNQVYEYEPSLKNADIVEEWVGLRPGRSTVRLEKSILSVSLDCGKVKSVIVIHNYGHFNKGVFLSRGCAEEVVELILNGGIVKSM